MAEPENHDERNRPHIPIDLFRETAAYEFPARDQKRKSLRDDYAAHAQHLLDQLACYPHEDFATGYGAAGEGAQAWDGGKALGELTRGERNIRWIQTHCRIPEGKDVGKAVRLRPWQKAEIAARTIKALRDESPDVDEQAVVTALGEFDQLWAALYPAEQSRIVQLLVERVTVGEDGIAVDLRHEGLGSVLRDMMAPRQTEARA